MPHAFSRRAYERSQREEKTNRVYEDSYRARAVSPRSETIRQPQSLARCDVPLQYIFEVAVLFIPMTASTKTLCSTRPVPSR